MTLGGVGAASLAIPFITSMNPGKDTLALASTEIDLSPLKIFLRGIIMVRKFVDS
jgi:ubiquinol-cytochrome c reductase iron-sulfur subunit